MRIYCFISSKDGCAKIDWNRQNRSGEEDFLILLMYFCCFLIISPWKRVVSRIWPTLNPLQPRMAQWFWRRRFSNFVNVFALFQNYHPLKKVGALHLKKYEFPSAKHDLCQVRLKLAQWFWRRRFFNFVNIFSLFLNYLPLEECGTLHSTKLVSGNSVDCADKVIQYYILFWPNF